MNWIILFVIIKVLAKFNIVLSNFFIVANYFVFYQLLLQNKNHLCSLFIFLQVAKIDINYARTAKLMDVKKLKASMWGILVKPEDKQDVSLQWPPAVASLFLENLGHFFFIIIIPSWQSPQANWLPISKCPMHQIFFVLCIWLKLCIFILCPIKVRMTKIWLIIEPLQSINMSLLLILVYLKDTTHINML